MTRRSWLAAALALGLIGVPIAHAKPLRAVSVVKLTDARIVLHPARHRLRDGGLSGYTLVEPRPHVVADTYTVDPGVAWATTSAGKIEAWTIDGYLLHALRFFKGIAEGEPMVAGGADADRRPRFRAAMSPTETVEFIVESLYGGRLTAKNVRPAPFGGASGFRFELSYVTRDGVTREALVAGAIVKDRLHAIVYDGTALHHFGKYRPDAERVIDSVRLK